MLTRYLIFLYLKYLFFIFIALLIFFVGLDYIQNAKNLPNSANLQILYVIYKSFYASDLLFPVSIVFASIAAKIHLVRSNELIAIYSVGYSKKKVIKPFFWISMLIVLIFILLHTTSFSYAGENADNIKKYSALTNATSNLFFKYNNSYIFFKKLFPLQKRGENIRIFEVNNQKLKKIISAKNGYFIKNSWNIQNATMVKNLKDRKIEIKKNLNLTLLKGFKPKILDSVYEGKTSFSILDAIYAIKLLKKQNIDIQKIKAALYAQLIYPFFAPFLMIIIFYFVPITQRIFSMTIFSFGAIISTLFIWGVLFTLMRLSFAGTLIPEISTILPVTILAIAAFMLYKRNI